MIKGNRVAVILAAYNGINWIEEQIQSILAQEEVQVTIFVSVDSSTDGTEDLVRILCNRYANIIALPFGYKFGGAARNFYRLLEEVDYTDFDFVSLSDQDDIWYPRKLINAIGKIREDYDFYSSNVLAFWPNGKRIVINKAQKQVAYDHFFEAAGPGCTYVFKAQRALEIKAFIRSNHNSVSDITLHDWLIYAFARQNNYRWYIDEEPSMDYRQHGNNQVGANVTFSAALKRLALIKRKWYRQEIIKLATLMRLPDNHFIYVCLRNNYSGNIKMLININKIRRRFRDRAVLFFLCLMNWL